MKILVIDDEKIVRDMIAKILVGKGHEVSEAPTFEQGVAMAKIEQPRLILADLRLREQSEIQTAPRLRELGKAAPGAAVIAVSGYGESSVVAAALEAGAEAFIPKNGEMIAKVLQACDRLGADKTLSLVKQAKLEETKNI